MYELNVYVEFPSGSLVLIPSSLVTHGNTPIGPNEERSSIVWFSAGTLFQYRDAGYQSLREMRKDPKQAAAYEEALAGRIKKAMSSLMTYEEFFGERL